MSRKEEQALKLEAQLCFPLYAASNLLTRLYRPLLEKLGLTYPQYLVMLVLWERRSANVGELSAALHLDSGTLTPLLKRLEANGLVRRERSAEDERRVEVSLTREGEALKKRALEVPGALACRVGLGNERFIGLRAELRALMELLGEANSDA
jgi:MarR family transcriptional regulator, organic hydroperoxide resistance regulator